MIKLYLVAEFEGSVISVKHAREHLDKFREAVQPSQEFGIVLTEVI